MSETIEIPALRKPPIVFLDDIAGSLGKLEPIMTEKNGLCYYVYIDVKSGPLKIFSDRIKVDLPIPASTIKAAMLNTDIICHLGEPKFRLPFNRHGIVDDNKIDRVRCPHCDHYIAGTHLSFYMKQERENRILLKQVSSLESRLSETTQRAESVIRENARLASGIGQLASTVSGGKQ